MFAYDDLSRKREALRVALSTSLLAPETGIPFGYTAVAGDDGGDSEGGAVGGGGDTATPKTRALTRARIRSG